MYRILPKKCIFFALAWLVIGLLLTAHAIEEFASVGIRISTVPSAAWIVFNLLLLNPVWRWIWKKVPSLNRWVFPDLNGVWDVELCSNWPRQLQLLELAMALDRRIDMRMCDVEDLAPLSPIHLRAEIRQTWWDFEMVLCNPRGDTPIDRSNTISVDPFRRAGMQPPGICYFYEQQNATDNVSDDTMFFGAAKLTYDFKHDQLEGLAWTARMWRRAINTAGPITFRRHTA